MLIASRQSFWNSGLPYTSKVEFIESTDDQWIDTLINPSSDGTMTIDFCGGVIPNETGPSRVRWSGNPTYDTYGLYPRKDNVRMGCYWGRFSDGKYNLFDVDASKRMVVIIDKNKVYINGNLEHTFDYSFFQSPYTLPLFATYDVEIGIKCSNTRIYKFSYFDNSQSIELSPVRKENNGCMYDSISKTLFENKGTIPFVYGNDI